MNKIVQLSLITIAVSMLVSPILASEATKLTGGGWYLTQAPYSTFVDHRASFGIQTGGQFQQVTSGQYIINDVSGSGSFMDRDYRLKAILRVEGGTYIPEYDGAGTYWVGVTGTARVYIDNKFVQEYVFNMAFAVIPDGTSRVWFQIADLSYIAWGDLVGGNVVFHI